MEIKYETVPLEKGIRFSATQNNKEVGRAYLYLLYNSLHKKPFGFIEDVFVEEEARGKGIGTQLIKKVIDTAINTGCYKIICTSRYGKENVHDMYVKLGFKDHGKEFRLNTQIGNE